MSTLTVKELAAPTGFDLKIAAGETLDLKSQGTVTMPAGAVLQVVNMTYGTTQAITSTSWADTGLTLAITPSSTSSKIRIDYSFYNIHFGATASGLAFRITRNGSSIFTPTAAHGDYVTSGGYHWGRNGIAIDSPSSTSAVTYKIQVQGYNTNLVTINSSSAWRDNLVLTEIAG